MRVLLLEVVEGPVSLLVWTGWFRTGLKPGLGPFGNRFKNRLACLKNNKGTLWNEIWELRWMFWRKGSVCYIVPYMLCLWITLEIWFTIVICKPKKYHLKRKSTDLIKTFQFSFKNGHQQKPKAQKSLFVRSCPFIPFYLNLVPTRFLGSTTQPVPTKKTGTTNISWLTHPNHLF